MTRSLRRRSKPASPEQIMLAAAQRRALEREQLKDASTWGVANDTVALPTGENVQTRQASKRVVFANRQDPFDTLHRKGGLSPAQHQAAKRLFQDWCISMGIRTSDPGDLMQVVDQQRSTDLITVAMIDAGLRFERALSLVGRGDAAVLKALIQPAVMCGTSLVWRAEVARVTGEKDPHCQGSVVRRACENLREAYLELDHQRAQRRRAAAAEQMAGANDAELV